MRCAARARKEPIPLLLCLESQLAIDYAAQIIGNSTMTTFACGALMRLIELRHDWFVTCRKRRNDGLTRSTIWQCVDESQVDARSLLVPSMMLYEFSR